MDFSGCTRDLHGLQEAMRTLEAKFSQRWQEVQVERKALRTELEALQDSGKLLALE